MPINLAIVGLSGRDPPSWASIAHLNPLRSPPLSTFYHMVALCTSSPLSANVAAEKYGVAKDKAYSSITELAKDLDIDMVVIAVKVPLHKQLAMPILEVKKDVLVEWPLARNLAEAEELAACAKRTGTKTMVGLQGRQVAAVKKAKEIIASGILGHLVSTSLVAMHASLDLPEKADYYNDYANGSNFITNRCGHTLDALTYTLGEFVSLEATTNIRFPTVNFIGVDGRIVRTDERRTADSLSVQGTLEGGASASVHIYNSTEASTPPMPLIWTITGTKGCLKLESTNGMLQLGPPKLYQYLAAKGDIKRGWEEVELPAQIAVGGVGEAYLAYAKGERLPDFGDALLRHRMLDAIFRSAKQGTRESYEISM